MADNTKSQQDDPLPELSSMSILQSKNPQQIRIKNRRKRYLDLHPEYFGAQLELADPLLYDRLIRRFQSNLEREAEGRKKGYSGILEADLLRGEAKMEALRHPDPNSLFTYSRAGDGSIIAEDKDEIPTTKEEGLDRWKDIMQQRFLSGKDDDFDYVAVDNNEEYDDKQTEEQEAQDVYFDGQSPEFLTGNGKSPQGETGIQDF